MASRRTTYRYIELWMHDEACLIGRCTFHRFKRLVASRNDQQAASLRRKNLPIICSPARDSLSTIIRTVICPSYIVLRDIERTLLLEEAPLSAPQRSRLCPQGTRRRQSVEFAVTPAVPVRQGNRLPAGKLLDSTVSQPPVTSSFAK